MVLVELGFRRFAPKSKAYARWTAFFQGIGSVWTAVILSLVYVLSVGPIGVLMRLFGKDPLDRELAPEPSFWRAHEPNPLGPERGRPAPVLMSDADLRPRASPASTTTPPPPC